MGGDGAAWLSSDSSRTTAQQHNANIPSEHPGWIPEFDALLGTDSSAIIAVPLVPDEQMLGLHADIEVPDCCINSIQATGGNLSDINQCMICPGGLSDTEEAAAVAACYRASTVADPEPGSGPASGAGSESGTTGPPIMAILIGIPIVLIVLWFLFRAFKSKSFVTTPQISPGFFSESSLKEPLL